MTSTDVKGMPPLRRILGENLKSPSACHSLIKFTFVVNTLFSFIGCSHLSSSNSHLHSAANEIDIHYTWTELGELNTLWVRTTTSRSTCPEFFADNVSRRMTLRPNLDPSSFPIMVCEAQIPQTARSATLAGKAVPILKENPTRILVIGDTGCKIKFTRGKYSIQACNDPQKWPLAQVAQSAAHWSPDVVIHVGDYHYREADCPDGHPKCKGTISGDRFASWRQDFFEPMKPLLETAPWIFVRGNHELCSRAGNGWFQFFYPRAAPSICTDATEPELFQLGDHQIAVIDSADDKNIEPSLSELSEKFSAPTWLVLHRPFLTPGADDETTTTTHVPTSILTPGILGLVLAGHQHRLAFNHFLDGRPPELVSGNGGAKLEHAPESSDGATTSYQSSSLHTHSFWDFGFTTLERKSGSSWVLEAHDRSGNVVLHCNVSEHSDEATSLDCVDAKALKRATHHPKKYPKIRK